LGKIFWEKGNAIEPSKKHQGGEKADSFRKLSNHRLFSIEFKGKWILSESGCMSAQPMEQIITYRGLM